MEALRHYLDQILPLSEEEWQAFSSLFQPRRLERKAFFAEQGRYERQFAFLETGVVRAFFRSQEGLEYNKTFFTDGEFFGASGALYTGGVNRINLQALTDCAIWVASYPDLVALFEPYRRLETMARRIAESFYVLKEKREIELALLQADERYRIFQEEYPGLENLIPQYHIASYLSITPTQLSRIRAKREVSLKSLPM